MSAERDEIEGKIKMAIRYTRWAMGHVDAPWEIVRNKKEHYTSRGPFVWVRVFSPRLGFGGHWRLRKHDDVATDIVIPAGENPLLYAAKLND